MQIKRNKCNTVVVSDATVNICLYTEVNEAAIENIYVKINRKENIH